MKAMVGHKVMAQAAEVCSVTAIDMIAMTHTPPMRRPGCAGRPVSVRDCAKFMKIQSRLRGKTRLCFQCERLALTFIKPKIKPKAKTDAMVCFIGW